MPNTRGWVKTIVLIILALIIGIFLGNKFFPKNFLNTNSLKSTTTPNKPQTVSSTPTPIKKVATSSPTPTPPTPEIKTDWPPRWQPKPETSWQIQFDKLPIDQSVNATIYDIDLFENNADVVEKLHAAGRRVLCYINAGAWENWRPDAKEFSKKIIGKTLAGYAAERWLNINDTTTLRPIMERRLDICKGKGFDGVDFDNIDGYTQKTGFTISYQNQIVYNEWLAKAAHDRGLAVGFKNNLKQAKDLEPKFDFTISEQCFEFKECDALTPFTDAGKAVFDIEYVGKLSDVCVAAKTRRISVIKKNLALDSYREVCP